MKESVRKQIHMGGFSPEKTMNSVRGLRTLYGKSYVEVVKKSCVEPQSMESNVFGSDSSHVNDAKDNMDMVKWDNGVNDDSWLNLCAVGVLNIIKVVSSKCSFSIQVREDQNPINLDWISKRLGIGKGVLGASKHDRSFQLHEKNDNSIHDHFNSRCSIGSMEGSKEAQKFLANQISFRKMSIGNKENHLHLASKKDIGSGSSGLGPNGKPPKVCPQPKRVHFKENGLSSVLVCVNRLVSPTCNGIFKLVRNIAFCDGRVETNDESEDSTKDNSLADFSL
ncbi:hypothetical protein LWI28_005736 [Acer negundo]|uniref:Uncharacterized protein n=1 Tax=Acer negundo TaxID=4023 RepID=A0AAD5JSP5_ACENE|nr:hypothetical protein LWI28_005736 [Acer negundo]